MENVKNISGEYPIPLSITTAKFYVDIYISQTIGSGAKAKKELINVRSVLTSVSCFTSLKVCKRNLGT